MPPRPRLLLAALALLGAAAASPARADRLVLPSDALDRTGPVQVAYRLDAPATGQGVLSVAWTDSAGRVVERQRLPVHLAGGSVFHFTIDLRRAVVMRNTLHATLTLHGPGGAQDGMAEARFIATPPGGPWRDWQAFEYQMRNPAQLAALTAMGITAGKVTADRDDADPKPVGPMVAPYVAADWRWYVENIATDFYSAYHRWQPNLKVNQDFLDAKALYRKDPSAQAPFLRHPSLSDPAWQQRIDARLERTVRAFAPYRPFYYDLADEPGIADLSSAWDFDLSPDSLAGMRAWLRTQYPNLDALNAEWGTHFARWDDVVPMTTDAAMRREGENFAPWADFKAWMDVAFACALRHGTDAVHAADPHALAAMEGGQVPGWGGYNYARLAHAVDAMEIYDADQNVAIARSLNPSLVLLQTSFAESPVKEWRLWHDLLLGARGTILWDDPSSLVNPDGTPGPWGRRDADLFRALHDGLGALLINAQRPEDAVAILYSPPSFRVQWMLDQRPKGTAWTTRDAEAETKDDALRVARGGAAEALARLGLRPRYLTPALLAGGALHGERMLILPHAIALSPADADAIRRFVRDGGTVVADETPGVFDAHGRHLAQPLLQDLFPSAGGTVHLGQGRAVRLDLSAGQETEHRLAALLAGAGLTPPVTVRTPDGGAAEDVQIHRYRSGTVTLLALQRLLSPAGEAAAPEDVVVSFGQARHVYDVRHGHALGRVDHVALRLGPAAPAILALSDTALAPPVLSGPAGVGAGGTAVLHLHVPGAAPDVLRVLHVTVRDPSGHAVALYSGNLLAAGGEGTWRIPFALNDPAGAWTVEASDLLSGAQDAVRIGVGISGGGSGK